MSQDKNTSSTVDPDEVIKFGYDDAWWDLEGPAKPLHKLNKLRIPFVQDCLKDSGKLHSSKADTSTSLENVKILDIGCGGGIVCEPFAQLGAKVTGVDVNEDVIRSAKAHAKKHQTWKHDISYICAALEDITEEYKDYFDVVFASECVEHVANVDTFLKACAVVCKPGGSLILTTFNKTTLAWTYGIIFLEDKGKYIPKGTHEFKKFLAPQKIQDILKKYNCKTNLVKGLFYYGNEWMWVKDDSANYAFHAQKNN